MSSQIIGSLEGTVVVIFGGSSGIGKSVALGSAKQKAAKIHLVARTLEKLESAKAEVFETGGGNTQVEITSLDAQDESKVRSFFEKTFKDGEINHLVTTPGSSTRVGNLVANERTCEDVRHQLDMKFFCQLAPVLGVRSKMADKGSITMISGVLSRRIGRGNDALSISNVAIETTVKCLANDFGYSDGRQIRINCLSPGMTLTPIHGDSEAVRAYQAKIAAAVPVQRNGLPEEMADGIFFLQKNTFVTGLVLDLDGGFLNMP